MPRLSIFLLGPLQVTLDGEPVTSFESDKVRALLAYLAVENSVPHRRERLAGLLWPEQPEQAARTNLRHVLANLRKVLGDYGATPPVLLISRQTIQFNRASDAWVDAWAFADLVQRDQHAREQTVRRQKDAAKLYRGGFLEGFSLPGCPAFEAWALLEGERLRRMALEALSRLSDGYEGQGNFDLALECSRRQIEIEPWLEAAHRQVMRLLALCSQRGAALAQYETCRRLLVEELGVEPGVETTQLYEQIRDSAPEFSAAAPTPFQKVMPSRELATGLQVQPRERVPESQHARALVYNLPPQPTPFYGREDELSRLERLFGDPAAHLVVVVGPGGIGKTRLALAAGAQAAESQRTARAEDSTRDFPHGIVFVRLAALTSPEDIAPAIAQALDARLTRGPEQLLDVLRRKQILLILDNFEHLPAGIDLLVDIIRAAPGVKILVTSRERLRLRGENVLRLRGLAYPECDSAPANLLDVEAYPAIKLFLGTVRRVHPEFAPDRDELAAVMQICCLVEGMPLALELAASWADALSLSDILAEARQSLGFLQAEWPDLPVRQRSMRAVFDASWQRLSQTDQAAFCQLSVFRGGFSRGASGQVMTVAEATPHLLAALVRKSFLQHDSLAGRYQIHELLRQYGAEKLANDPALEAAVRDQHSRYYSDLLARQNTGVEEGRLHDVMLAIQADIENVRAACIWAAAEGRLKRLEPAVNHLGWFYYRLYADFQQGESTFRRLSDALTAMQTSPSPATASTQRATARILAWRSMFRIVAMDLQTGRGLLQESLALLEGPALATEDTTFERAFIFWESGYLRLYTDAAEARQRFARAVELYRQAGHKLGLAYGLLALGRAASVLGALEEARDAITQSIALFRDMGSPVGESESTATLANRVAIRQFRFQEAEDLIQRSLSLTRGQAALAPLLDSDNSAWCSFSPAGSLRLPLPRRIPLPFLRIWAARCPWFDTRFPWPGPCCMPERMAQLATKPKRLCHWLGKWVGTGGSATENWCSARWRWPNLPMPNHTRRCKKA